MPGVGDTVAVLDHGFVRLDAAEATDLSVVNGARVSFLQMKDAAPQASKVKAEFHVDGVGTWPA